MSKGVRCGARKGEEEDGVLKGCGGEGVEGVLKR